ncbi:hypothetical protein B0T22DRAFT_489040 [Podospora appendiculata]|uniref:Phosphoglycerate mutase n=1 Tax=Podospora appendiculata TaxID=314037 RepID=A0AAE0XM44_9PEZI|nr:hypothetical protein B0T22DRAFT_489040 [Podospora appendiculata]
MACQTPEPDSISKVHIIFQRHGQAISNVVDFTTPGIDAQKMTSDELRALAATRRGYLQTGVLMPDGLTQFGLDASKTFIDAVTDRGARRLDNVYMLVSSPLTRAYQTIKMNQPAFDLVGPFHAHPALARVSDDPANKAAIYCHPGLQEATTWVQDFPAVVRDHHGTETKTVSYIGTLGGKGPGAGTVLGEMEVDVSTMIWPHSAPSRWVTFDDRIKAATGTPLNLAEIENAAKQARIWLREQARLVLQTHQNEGRAGTPRIIVCLHVGIINFVVNDWHRDYKRVIETGEWKWAGSGALRNLEMAVYTFESLEGSEDDPVLKELGHDAYYARTLGGFYRHLGSDEALVYRNPNGAMVDQKAGHWQCIQEKERDVLAFVKERREVFEGLLMWTGAKDYLGSVSLNGVQDK